MTTKSNGISLMLIALILALSNFTFISCSGNTSDTPLVEKEVEEEKKEEEKVETTCTTGKLFIEKDGLVRVDAENSSSVANGWATKTGLVGFEGSGYLEWTGADSFSNPGQGTIKFSIKITNPGTYQFVWSSRISQGTSSSEHNDSWLRIASAADFYGEKASTGEKVYPKGTGKTPNPEGSSKDGWLKVYMNKLGEWLWRANTNDKYPFNVFAKFDVAGVYDIEISGRSKGHAIDQFVLFKTGQTLTVAKSATLSEITCK